MVKSAEAVIFFKNSLPFSIQPGLFIIHEVGPKSTEFNFSKSQAVLFPLLVLVGALKRQ